MRRWLQLMWKRAVDLNHFTVYFFSSFVLNFLVRSSFYFYLWQQYFHSSTTKIAFFHFKFIHNSKLHKIWHWSIKRKKFFQISLFKTHSLWHVFAVHLYNKEFTFPQVNLILKIVFYYKYHYFFLLIEKITRKNTRKIIQIQNKWTHSYEQAERNEKSS